MGEAKRRKALDSTWGKSKLLIRKCQNSERKEVIKIFDEINPVVHSFLPKAVLDKQKEDLIGIEQKIWVAEIDKKVIGFISLINEKLIGAVYVLEDFRGNGYGTKLVEHLKSLKENLELGVYENNHAFSFYEKLGFTVVKEGVDNGFKFFLMSWKRNI